MQKIFVFKRIRIDYVAADDVEEFLQLACIAVVHGSAIDDVGARLVVFRIIFQGKARREMPRIIFVSRRFDGAEFEGAFRAADDETAVFHAVDFRDGDANGGGGDGIFEDGEAVVDEAVVSRLPHERRNLVRLA